jgi:hypothetical protein
MRIEVFRFRLWNVFFYNIAQRNMKKEIFCVDIELYQHARLLANQRSEFTNAIL